MHIAEYDEMANKLDEIKEYSNFLPDVSTDDGYQKSKRVSLDIGKVKTSLEKARKDKKSFFIEGGKQVDTQAKLILKKLDDMQLPHMEAYKELDNLKKEREAKRKQELEERVSFMRNMPELMSESSSDEITGAMNDLNQQDCEGFYEFTSAALKTRNDSVKALGELLAKALKAEKDAEELAELRKLQALRDQKDRDDKIALEARQKAEAIAKENEDRIEREKQEAIQREEQAKQAQANAERQVAEAKERETLAAQQAQEQQKQHAINTENARIAAEEQQKQAAINAENARIQAEEQRKQDAVNAENNARIAAENAKQEEIKRQQDELKAKQKADAKLQADKDHVGMVRAEIKEHIMSTCNIDEELAVNIVKALLKIKTRVTINH